MSDRVIMAQSVSCIVRWHTLKDQAMKGWRLAILWVTTLLATSASAGIVGEPVAFGGPGGDQVIVPLRIFTFQPDNENVVGSSINADSLEMTFDALGYIDLSLSAEPSAGVTEYLFTERVTNNTGGTWGGFSIVLGMGFGPAFAPGSESLDFDTPERDSPARSERLTLTRHEPDLLAFGMPVGVLPGETVTFEFALDVGNLPQPTSGMATFTIRHTPSPVPLPASILFLTSGAAVLLRAATRRAS